MFPKRQRVTIMSLGLQLIKPGTAITLSDDQELQLK